MKVFFLSITGNTSRCAQCVHVVSDHVTALRSHRAEKSVQHFFFSFTLIKKNNMTLEYIFTWVLLQGHVIPEDMLWGFLV